MTPIFNLSIFFFVIAHSTSLYFLLLEKEKILIKELIFPISKKRKTIPLLAFILSIFFAALSITTSENNIHSNNFLKVTVIFSVIPVSLYAIYLISGLKRDCEKYYFREPKSIGKKLLIATLLVVAILNFL